MFCLQEFAGNEDRDEERQQFLKSPFIARYVRIHPTNWHRHIGLRAGLLGCPYVGQSELSVDPQMLSIEILRHIIGLQHISYISVIS